MYQRINKMIATCMCLFSLCIVALGKEGNRDLVDYVNPYMGNISHMLVPTYPMIHLPNSMLRIRPERGSYTDNHIYGLQVLMPSHRGGSVFRISPFSGDINNAHPIKAYSYDNEEVKPYHYQVYLDEEGIEVDFAPSHQSAIYELSFERDEQANIVFHSGNGKLNYDGEAISGYQDMGYETKVYWYLESEKKPEQVAFMNGDKVNYKKSKISAEPNIVLRYGQGTQTVRLRYGISFISVEQAKKNLYREIDNYDLVGLAMTGRAKWNEQLSKIEVQGGSEEQKEVFYTSLYRTLERMINISEDGRYWSGADKKVHDDNGMPFYVDDWIWDTYLAVHPLNAIIDKNKQTAIISSYIRMAQQSKEGWMPTFPEVHHDSHRMNGNHTVAIFADALNKGIDFDVATAYQACRKSILEETHAPWTRRTAGEFDQFYKDHGYFPALKEGENEFLEGINGVERRQAVAVTLAAAYDDFCMSVLAEHLNKTEDVKFFANRALNYRNLFHPETHFFHPKDHDGQFIEPFNYKFSGGMGARDYYDENNGWTYRWDVKHNIGDLIQMMGGNERFCANLDQLFNEGLGMVKWDFMCKLPDQTGNVGQFSMGNEPSFHIPYLYNYAGQPWKTQKRIRSLLNQWFRSDLMGIPGDEDGGGMSAFVVFSSMGFYPVTPGVQEYNIGSPVFNEVTIHLENGKVFTIKAENCSDNNKYIQSATLNGESYHLPFFTHKVIENGGKLVLIMGNKANRKWGVEANCSPYSLSDNGVSSLTKID